MLGPIPIVALAASLALTQVATAEVPSVPIRGLDPTREYRKNSCSPCPPEQREELFLA